MATSNLPNPQLQPVADAQNLLNVVDDGGSCCGSSCGCSA